MFWIFKAIVNFWTGLKETQFSDTLNTQEPVKGCVWVWMCSHFFIQSDFFF